MYPPETRDTILERIASGESLSAICRDDNMPGMSVVFTWLKADKDFSDKYARAREAQADVLFDKILEIADDPKEDPRRSKLRIDARMWAASKLKPKVYGDKIEQTHEVGESFGKIVREIVRGT
jgi:hypothetical protein